MFEKLITDLKKSLPESLRKKLGGAEEVEEEEAQEEAVESEDSDAAALSSDEEKKKKRNSMIIKVIVIVGIGYFAIDEFVLKTPGEPTVEELLAKAPKRKRPKPVKPADQAAAATADAGSTPNTETDPSATVPPTTPPDVNIDASSGIAISTAETAPIENVNILDKSAETTPTTTSTPEVEPQPEVEQPPIVTETRVVEPNVDQRLDQLVENVEQTAPSNPVEEIKIPSHTETPSTTETKDEAPSMASKIVEVITETPPPAYDQLGRGLVYNCKDKYWACLDKPAYVTCNKNMKWNKSKGNAAECAVSNIYASEEDCAKVQKYNVSTNASTAICN